MWWKKLIPNILTGSRFFFGVVIFLTLQSESLCDPYLTSLVLYVVGALTDTLDGIAARLLKVESDFGKFFEKWADMWMAIWICWAFQRLGIISGRVLFVGVVYALVCSTLVQINRRFRPLPKHVMRFAYTTAFLYMFLWMIFMPFSMAWKIGNSTVRIWVFVFLVILFLIVSWATKNRARYYLKRWWRGEDPDGNGC